MYNFASDLKTGMETRTYRETWVRVSENVNIISTFRKLRTIGILKLDSK